MKPKTIYQDIFIPPLDSKIPSLHLYVLATAETITDKLIAVEMEASTGRRSAALKKIFANARIVKKLLPDIRKQFSEYFARKRQTFDIPLTLYGTEFQKNVWKTVLSIPYGNVISYKAINEKISPPGKAHPLASRSIGTAVGTNPISIIIPCHRVLNALPQNQYRIGHYGGGKAVKECLLRHEEVYKNYAIQGNL